MGCMQAGAVPRSYSAFLDAGGLRGARVGVLRQLSNSPTADPEFLGIFDASLSSMAQAGVRAVCLLPASLLCSEHTLLRSSAGAAVTCARLAAPVGMHAHARVLRSCQCQGLLCAGATVVDNFTIAGNNMGANWCGCTPPSEAYILLCSPYCSVMPGSHRLCRDGGDAQSELAACATIVRRQGWIPGKGTSYGFWNVAGNWEDLWNCQAAFPADFDAYAQGPNRTQHFRSLEARLFCGPHLALQAAATARSAWPLLRIWLGARSCCCLLAL
jgi:hypothetical protein